MANNIAFQAMGKTYKATVTTSSQSFQITSDMPCNQVCVANHQPTTTGGQPVYFVFGNSSVTCTLPTGSGANATYCLVSVPGTIKTYTVPKQFNTTDGLYVAFISEGTSECYFTPGEGL